MKRVVALKVIRPVAEHYDRTQEVPWDVLREARKRDMYGLELIQQFATDGLCAVLYAEEIHWGCAGIALALSASSLAAAGIASSGTPEQIAQWVPQCYGLGDEIKLGAYAVTEPQAGSDVKSLRTTAKRDGDEWVLNGTKVFISNGGIADVTVVVATVDPELGHRGQASFIVEKGTPGFSLDFLEGREENGEPLLEQQRVQQVLADVAMELDSARLLVYRAAWMGRNGIPMTAGQGSMSKLKAGEVAMWCTTALMDLIGPEAGSEEHPLQKYFRDAKIFQLFEGTSQIQRLVISRMQTAERRKDREEAGADEAPANGDAVANGEVEAPAAATA